MFVCLCHAVTEHEIRATVSLGAGSLEDVSSALGVGTSCGRCREHAQSVITDCRGFPGHRHCGASTAAR